MHQKGITLRHSSFKSKFTEEYLWCLVFFNITGQIFVGTQKTLAWF